MAKNVLWEELSWSELKVKATENPVVIIPVGSMEQHGPHLPVKTDTILVSYIARKIAETMVDKGQSTLVGPAIWTGNSRHHMDFPGTISLDYSTFEGVIQHTCLSMHSHGFYRLVLLNGHGGNRGPLRMAITKINEEIGRPVFCITYWDPACNDMPQILEVQKGVEHSGEAETSMMMVIAPDLVRLCSIKEAKGPDVPDPKELSNNLVYTFRTLRNRTSTGVFGDATVASKEKGEKLLRIIVNRIVDILSRPSLWKITV
ncbi:Creatinine amidohydrolase [subsurface metagenome]